MMNLFRFLFVCLFFLSVSCNRDSDKKDSPSNETIVASTTPDSPSVPVVTPPDEIDDSPLSAGAGKISLWDRSAGYDCAVFLPADYGKDSNKQYPVVISLHGLNGSVLNTAHTAPGGEKTGFIKQVWNTALAKTFPAIVIAPNWAPAGSTSSGLWVHSLLRQLILEAKDKYQVDADRIVITGLSAGSIGTQELLKYSKDLIAAAMPAAYAPVVSACEFADIPVWSFGNNSDSYFNSAKWQSTKPQTEACGNYIHEFTLTVYNSTCGHGCWDSHWAKPEVQQWLVNQSK